jgi:hypothetical protein
VNRGGSPVQTHVQTHSTTTIETTTTKLGRGGPGSATGLGTGPAKDSSSGADSPGAPLVPPRLGLPEPGLGDGALLPSAPLPSAPRDESALERASSPSAGPAAPAGPGTPCCGSSTDLGAAGFAPPSGGSSAPALALPTFKLAAPAPTGPQLPAPILGRSVASPEPFERPG